MSAVGSGALVDVAINRFLAVTDHQRLRLYRMFLQSTVRSVSPLTLAFAEHYGIDLEIGLGKLRPPLDWPRRPVPSPPVVMAMSHRASAASRYIGPRAATTHGLMMRYATTRGFVHHGPGSNLLLFDVDGAWLSVQGRIGECTLQIVKGRAFLTLPAGIPDTMVAAMTGRNIDTLVDHPALRGRGWRVRRVIEAASEVGSTIVFATGRQRYRMPWPELLRSNVVEAFLGRGRKRASAGSPVAGHPGMSG